MTESYPRRSARTRRFTLGVPRDITIAPDGRRVVFLRSRTGIDPVTCLWELDVATGVERCIVDPRALDTDAGAEEYLPPEERARRERVRESAGGVVAYTADDDLTRVAFALGGSLRIADLAADGAVDGAAGEARRLETPPGTIDPSLSPDGRHVAYVTDGSLHVQDLATGDDRTLAERDDPDVSWGLAEFIAAEELDRMRGMWWSPDSSQLLAQRTDVSHVQRWHIGDPANPESEPQILAYPAAGTTNATVGLWLLGLDGSRIPVYFDDEYLTEVTWDRHALSLTTLTRDQRDLRIWTVDAATGSTSLAWAGTDAAWMDVQPGLPMHLADGSTVWLADTQDTRRLFIGGAPVTPPGLQVREVMSVDGDRVLFRASTEPTTVDLWVYSHADRSIERVSPSEPGIWSGRLRGGTLLVNGQTLATEGTTHTVVAADSTERIIGNVAEAAGITPRVTLLRAGSRRLRHGRPVPHRPRVWFTQAPRAPGSIRRSGPPARHRGERCIPWLPVVRRPGLRGHRRGWPGCAWPGTSLRAGGAWRPCHSCAHGPGGFAPGGRGDISG